MACGCGKKSGPAPNLSWSVDLSGTGKTFGDGTIRKVYATNAEANVALADLALAGAVRPKPTTS